MAKEKSDGVHLIRSAQTLARIVARFEKKASSFITKKKELKMNFEQQKNS